MMRDYPQGDPEDRCQRCLLPNLMSWHAPSPLWNAVMRHPDGAEDYGIVCPRCFAELAEARGVVSRRTVWHVTAEPMPGLPQTSPDGRLWDPDQCLWVASADVST